MFRSENSYKVLKVCTSRSDGRPVGEYTPYDHLVRATANIPGTAGIPLPVWHFQLINHHRKHDCFVFEPAKCAAAQVTPPTGSERRDFVISVLRAALHGLDVLHTRAQMIHTDVKEWNVLMAFTSEEDLERYAQEMASRPLRGKTLPSGHVTYESFPDAKFDYKSLGAPMLADLSAVRIFDTKQEGGFLNHALVSPPACRAPEIWLAMQWNSAVDVWSLGCMFFRLLGMDIFAGTELSDVCKKCQPLAQMVYLMGPPPSELLFNARMMLTCAGKPACWLHPNLLVQHEGRL